VATFTVTTLDDSGPGSLRDAILQANGTPGPDRIEFAAGLTGTIALMSSLPTITDHLEIAGPGAAAVTLSGSGAVQILSVERGVNAAIDGLTFASGMAVDGGAILSAGRLTVTGCVFRTNTATNTGGAILNQAGILLVRGSTFDQNRAAQNGGAIANMSGEALVEGSDFTLNTAGGFAGAIYTMSAMTTVRSSRFTGSSAGSGGTFYLAGNRLAIADCTVADSTSGGQGGAILMSGEAEIARSTFLRNQATFRGGAIAILRGRVRLTDCTLQYNRTGQDGGALDIVGATAIIKRCILSRNTAGGSGGAISVLDKMLRVEDSDLIGNSAGLNGGGIYSTDSRDGTWVGVHGCNLVENTAAVAGGGVFTRNGVTEVTGSAIVRNRADFGGGAFNGSESVTRLVNVTLSQNRAAQGGAIFADDQMVEASFVTVNETVVSTPTGAAVASAAENSIYVVNSVFASTADEAGHPLPNCAGGVIDLGGNFSTDDSCPGFTVVSAEELALGPLLINAPGRTYTHALGAGSAAVGGASCRDAALQPVGADQRGVRRPQGRACDAGAYELAAEHKPKHGDHEDSGCEDDASDSSGR